MNIEQGDYFVIEKGRRVGHAVMVWGEARSIEDVTGMPNYDHSWDSFVFKAEEVCGVMIAARVIHAPDSSCCGRVVSLNTTGMELMTVSDQYAKVMAAQPNINTCGGIAYTTFQVKPGCNP